MIDLILIGLAAFVTAFLFPQVAIFIALLTVVVGIFQTVRKKDKSFAVVGGTLAVLTLIVVAIVSEAINIESITLPPLIFAVIAIIVGAVVSKKRKDNRFFFIGLVLAIAALVISGFASGVIVFPVITTSFLFAVLGVLLFLGIIALGAVLASQKQDRRYILAAVGLVAFGVLVAFLTVRAFPPPKEVESPKVAANREKEQKKKAMEAYNKGSLKEAAADLEVYIDSHPSDYEALTALAQTYWLLGKPKQAIKVYEELLEKYPNDPDTLYRMGIVYRNMGELKKSQIYLERAVKAKPKAAQFHAELGKAYALNHNYNESIKEWNKVLTLTPPKDQYRAIIYMEMGNVYLQMKKKKQAKLAFEKGLTIDSKNTYLKQQLEKL